MGVEISLDATLFFSIWPKYFKLDGFSPFSERKWGRGGCQTVLWIHYGHGQISDNVPSTLTSLLFAALLNANLHAKKIALFFLHSEKIKNKNVAAEIRPNVAELLCATK